MKGMGVLTCNGIESERINAEEIIDEIIDEETEYEIYN